METVEGTVRQAKELGEAATKRVKNDFETAYERSKTVLENWRSMKIMDAMWTAKARSPDKQASAPLRRYLVAICWLFLLFFFSLFYFVDYPAWTEGSIVFKILIRLGEISCLFLAAISLLCCFEQGLSLLLGAVLMVTLFWTAPPRKRD